ncbi:MAG: hypothetical protein JWP91_2287 [Fibrobacteres bacterium]|nr:hypothetical protein [Fibrobacterota bacterium]
MNLRTPALCVCLLLIGCDFGPAPLKLGEPPRTAPDGSLATPLNVGRAFSPTGYFYNVWAPADTTFTLVDPEKWNNFLAYQSIYQHPACKDRVPIDTLVKYDSTLGQISTPTGFYSEFSCTQFTYMPVSEDDLYGGVFWLKGNNFGNFPGVKVKGGARRIRFWARSLTGDQVVTFGVGATNFSSLKPWFYFSPNADEWGNPLPVKTPRFMKSTVKDPVTGVVKDTVVVQDSVPEGIYVKDFKALTEQWTLQTLNLNQIYNGFFHADGNPYDSLPDHRLIGAFYWALEKSFLRDTSRVTPFITDSTGAKRRVRYGSATILIDGIRYE